MTWPGPVTLRLAPRYPVSRSGFKRSLALHVVYENKCRTIIEYSCGLIYVRVVDADKCWA